MTDEAVTINEVVASVRIGPYQFSVSRMKRAGGLDTLADYLEGITDD